MHDRLFGWAMQGTRHTECSLYTAALAVLWVCIRGGNLRGSLPLPPCHYSSSAVGRSSGRKNGEQRNQPHYSSPQMQPSRSLLEIRQTD